jgi:4-amino-4-deoxy-L-arabinose transferase-like glycosyltransferase
MEIGRTAEGARARKTPPLVSPVPFPIQILGLLLLALLLSSLYPVGYLGGQADDGRYLQAIRCLVAEGYCLPANHWAARLPLVLPAAALTALFGESRLVLSLVPLLYAGGALTLFALLVRSASGERAAMLSTMVLVLTPIVMSRSQRLNVDMAELFYLLAGVWLLSRGVMQTRARTVLLAGVAFGLALLSRTSAVAAFPMVAAGLLLFTRRGVRWNALLATGGGTVLLCEAVLHAATAGDPLLRWRLELGHTRIPSTALPASVDLGQSPILNPEYIANWHRPAGIRVHWLLDGALNLLADPMVSLTLIAGAIFAVGLLADPKRHSGHARRRTFARQGWFLLAAALAHFCILAFVLAVHPTARMFLPIACICAFAIGAWADRQPAREGSLLIGGLFMVMLTMTAAVGLRSVRLPAYQQEAERWARENGGRLAISPTAASVFALSSSLSALEPATRRSRRPVLAIGPGCETPTDRSRLLRTFVHRPDAPLPYTFARRLGLAPDSPILCLVRPADQAAAPRS